MSDFGEQYYRQQYVAPQLVMGAHHSKRTPAADPDWKDEKSTRGYTHAKWRDPLEFVPGCDPKKAHPTPASILGTSSLENSSQPPLWASYRPAEKGSVELPRSPEYHRSQAYYAPIVFSENSVPGVWALDILAGRAKIDGGRERDLEQFKLRTIDVTLMWPGYSEAVALGAVTERHRLTVCTEKGKSITRFELAQQICEELSRFMVGAMQESLDPGADEMWTIGKHSITMKRVRLLALHCHRGVWVPDFIISG